MISIDGPVRYFQIVLKAARAKHETLSPSTQLPINSQPDGQLAKALDAMTITKIPCPPTTADSPAYTAIKECIQSAIDRHDH